MQESQTTALEWRYREYLGPNDAVAPKWGGYWIADQDDLVSRVWYDDENDVWLWDVTEAEEVEYGGTPCSHGSMTTRSTAQAEAAACLISCLGD